MKLKNMLTNVARRIVSLGLISNLIVCRSRLLISIRGTNWSEELN